MDVRLTIADANGTATDVLVDVSPQATVGQLTDALAREVPLSGPVLLDGRPLAPDLPVARVPQLVHGAVLSSDPRAAASVRAPVQGSFELRVIAGPSSGRRLALDGERQRVGRAATAALDLHDREVSADHFDVWLTDDGPMVEDVGSRNGTEVDRRRIDRPRLLAPGEVLTVGQSLLVVDRVEDPPAACVRQADGTEVLNPAPRTPERPPPLAATFPPAVASAPQTPLGVIVAVVLAIPGLALAVVYKRPEYLLFTLLGPLAGVGTRVVDRRAAAKQLERQRRERRQAVDAELARLAAALVTSERWMRRSHLDPAAAVARAVGRLSTVWECRRDDADAGLASVGLGPLPAELTVQGDAPELPTTLYDVPVTVPLGRHAVGLIGPAAEVLRLARWVLVQALTRRAPSDLSVTVIAPQRSSLGSWDWARWAPHAVDASGTVRFGRDQESIAARLDELVASLDSRAHRRADSGTIDWVVVVDGALALQEDARWQRIVADGPAAGVAVVCVADERRKLPPACRTTVAIDVDHPHNGWLVSPETGADGLGPIVVQGLDEPLSEAVTRAFAPLRDRAAGPAAGALPQTVRLLEQLGLLPCSPDAVAAAWGRPAPQLDVPIGAGVDGPYRLTLTGQNSHLLVGGTTGSGKSEFLRALVAGLVARNPPAHMNLVLVDFKGGKALSPFRSLPHVAGFVTDIDGDVGPSAYEVTRVLRSLRSELQLRKRALGQASARSGGTPIETIDDWWASGIPGALPHLFVVFDEFSELAELVDDLTEQLTSLARTGRSLGVHLVLATQRPQGAVTAELKAQVNARVALRMRDPEGSLDVIDLPDAAHIGKDAVGRALVSVELKKATEIQTGYVGVFDEDVRDGVTVRLLPRASLGRPLPTAPRRTVRGTTSDLAALSAAIDALGMPSTRRVWFAPLVPPVTLASLGAARPGTRWVPLGREDDPDDQAQPVFGIDLAAAHHLVLTGGPRSGRTTALQTLALSVATHLDVREAHVHIVDASAGGGLRSLTALDHVGVHVGRGDTDLLEALLDALTAEIQRRADDRAGDHPAIVLLIDTWEAVVDQFETVVGSRGERLRQLMRDGAALGLVVVIACDRAGRLGELAAEVEHKLVFRLSSATELLTADIDGVDVPDRLPDGQAVSTASGTVVQVAMALDGATDPADLPGVHRCLGSLPVTAQPLRLRRLPTTVDVADLAPQPGRPTFGVRHPDLAVVGWTLDERPVTVVVGPEGSGRSATLGLLCSARGERPVLVLTPLPSPLRAIAGPDVTHLAGPTCTEAAVEQWLQAVPGDRLVVVDDADALESRFDALVRTARTANETRSVVLLACQDPGRVPFGRQLDTSSAVLLSPADSWAGEPFGLRRTAIRPFSGPAGRAVVTHRRSTELVQLARWNAP